MGTAGARTGACPKAEQRNAEEEWEALTMFDKNKQMRAGGNLQGGSPVNLNSKNVKSQQSKVNQKHQISIRS